MRSPFLPMGNVETAVDEEQTGAKAYLMEKLERCSFCNSRLIFNHDLNLSVLQVVETSRCSGCGVTMLPKKFTLH